MFKLVPSHSLFQFTTFVLIEYKFSGLVHGLNCIKMKTFVVLLCLMVAAHAFKETLKTILKSPKNTRQLYKDFKAEQHLKFGSSLEERKRFKQFKINARFVALANEHSTTTKFALNFFSTMTMAEKRQYTGVNITGHTANSPGLEAAGLEAAGSYMREKRLWTYWSAVTKVQYQGRCGSCWAYAAVAAVETKYKLLSRLVLRKFSEQEYLDCVYETRNGCYGGWPQHCYSYSADRRSGQLASLAQYPKSYSGRGERCRTNKGNSLIAAKITGFVRVGGSEAENIQALNQGAISVAFEVTDYMRQYSSGILKDTNCKMYARDPSLHAVTAVGYTTTFILAKNSWSDRWGDRGFIRFARNHRNCGLFEWSSYPTLVRTGRIDRSTSDPVVHFLD